MKENISTNFIISRGEINRRIKAYTALIVSFFFSSIIFSLNYIVSYMNISLYIILSIGLFLIFTKIMLVRYFDSISRNKIILTSEYIIKNKNKYLIKDIAKISIKRTSRGYVREIKIIFSNKAVTYINNEIDNLEEFANKLQNYLSKDVIKKNISEPMNYDHPIFYPFLGIILSMISIQSIKLLVNLNIYQLHIIYYIISIFTIAMGLYFIIYKPIYKRDEKNNQITDYIWGISFITAGILIFIFYLI